MRLALAAALLALFASVSGAALAQKKKLDPAHEAVAAALTDAVSSGQSLAEPFRFVSVKEDETSSVTFKLDSQQIYWIYSRCEACAVTLTATDTSGAEIDDDTDKDGEAELLIPAKSTTQLKVEVKADSCEKDPCLIGLALYSQN